MYDYYKILDISRDASLEDIKRAYRNKAKLVHPDINNSPKANEVFVVVKEATVTAPAATPGEPTFIVWSALVPVKRTCGDS